MGSGLGVLGQLKIMVFGDKETVNAFMLAGIPGKIVGSGQETAEAIKGAKELAVAIVVEEYSPGVISEDLPIVITVPRRESG